MKDKFLIVYKLPPEADKLAHKLSADVSSVCGVADPHRRIPPHATLKSPFKANQQQIDKLLEKLNKFIYNRTEGNATLSGFDHFNKRIIYIDIQADSITRHCVDDLTAMLEEIDWLSLDKHDRHVLLHTTIARARSDAEFKEIWSYLQEEYEPKQTMPFDKIALLQLDTKEDKWFTYDEFYL